MMRVLVLSAFAIAATACDRSIVGVSPVFPGDLCGSMTESPVEADALDAFASAHLDQLVTAVSPMMADVVWEDGMSDVLSFDLDVDPEGMVRQQYARDEACGEVVVVPVDYAVSTQTGRLDVARQATVDLVGDFRNDGLRLGDALARGEAEVIRDAFALANWQDVWLNLTVDSAGIDALEVAYRAAEASSECRRAAVLADASDAFAAPCD